MINDTNTITRLKDLLDGLGIDCSDTDIDQVAIAIARFVYAKEIVKGQELTINESNDNE